MPEHTGAELIAAERQRQIDEEGYTPAHDAEHVNGELLGAALAYATVVYTGGEFGDEAAREVWPERWRFSPSDDPVRNLVKAGALIAAELDRRISETESKETTDA